MLLYYLISIYTIAWNSYQLPQQCCITTNHKISAASNNKYFLGVRRRGSADLSLRGCFGLGSHVCLSVSWQITWSLAGCADLSWDASSLLHVAAHPPVGWPDLTVSQQCKRERECRTTLPPHSVGKASHKARPDSRCGAEVGGGGLEGKGFRLCLPMRRTAKSHCKGHGYREGNNWDNSCN